MLVTPVVEIDDLDSLCRFAVAPRVAAIDSYSATIPRLNQIAPAEASVVRAGSHSRKLPPISTIRRFDFR
jgi:hypothetical protein